MRPRDLGDLLPLVVEEIAASYRADPRTQYVDRQHVPSSAHAANVCNLLLELSYPGFVGRQRLTRHNIAYHVGELVPRLWEELYTSIDRCLCHDRERQDESASDDCREDAVGRATAFIQRIPDVRRRLALDVQAHFDGDPAAISTSEVILAYPGMLAITIQRFAHELHRLGVPYFPRIMCEHAHRLTGIDIHPGATIGEHFCIDHGTGVVIGETTEIGDFVKVYQGVTLGALSFRTDERGRLIRGQKRHPTIGNNVTIYAGATILGGDTVIGDGAVIGGGVFITRSVAAGLQVALAPPVLKVRSPRSGDAPVAGAAGDYSI